MHGSLGSSLTSSALNATLCQSCHVSTGIAAAKLLVNSMQAVPGTGGTSHSWSGPIVNATYGAEIPTNAGVILRIEGTLKGQASQNSINNTTVTYASGNYTTNALAGWTIQFYTTAAGSSNNKNLQRTVSSNTATTVTWSPGLPQNPLIYDRYIVVPSSAKLSCSICHAQHSQQQLPWDPISNAIYNAGVTNNRHMMRYKNELNQLCEDCHRSRVMNYADAKNETLANGVKQFSHPVGDLLNSQGYDYAAPRDANGGAQTNSVSPLLANRFAGNVDGNQENNIVLDVNGKVRCLSCHRMHYEDSNSLTNSSDVK